MKKQPIIVAQIMGKWVGGGVEAVIMNYYRNIDRSKVQFDFICDEDSTNIPYDEIKKLGGRVIICPPYQKIFKYEKFLIDLFKKNNYKIVHSNINALSVFPLRAAKKAEVPIRIAHSHSTTNKKEWKKNLMKQALRPFSKKYATDYFACSELAGRWLFGDKTFEQGKVTIINNAIDLDKFKYDEKIRKEKRKELNIKDNTLVVGHIGRFVAQKNHTFLIDIFNELHKKEENSILLLIGQGPLMSEIKQKVDSLGISDSVKFLGQRDDVNELYQVFDVFLLPSLYEGLPVVGVEAQATGNLCILSDSMTQETKILDTTKFISLDMSTEEWVSIILNNYSKFKRHDTTDEITKNNFNIKKEKSELEKFYMQKKFLTQEEIKEIELKILENIHSICQNKKINYYLCGGTLLGAIRHNGYIPWDDDIDIFMFRDDYDKFINYMKSQNKYKNLIVKDSDDEEYYYPFAKIVDNTTIAIQEDNNTKQGIWVDVFPLNYLPNDITKSKKIIKKWYVYRSLIISMTTNLSHAKKNIKFFLKFFLKMYSKFIGKKRIQKKYNKILNECQNYNHSKYVACVWPTYGIKEILSVEKIKPKKLYKFENKKFYGPKDYDYYLKKIYGNYSILPPESERKCHNIIAWEKNDKY